MIIIIIATSAPPKHYYAAIPGEAGTTMIATEARVGIPAQKRPRRGYWPDTLGPGKDCHGWRNSSNGPIRIRINETKGTHRAREGCIVNK